MADDDPIHADGVFWAKWTDGSDTEPFLIEHLGREWRTLGIEDYYIDDYVHSRMAIIAGPILPPAPPIERVGTLLGAGPEREHVLPSALQVLDRAHRRLPQTVPEHVEANFCWDGSEVGAKLTCSCGHTEMRDIGVNDLIECLRCRRLWRPTRVVACELVTDEAEIAKFRLAYYGTEKETPP